MVGAEPFKYASTVPPKSVDWREKNAVSVVKNQQQVRVSRTPASFTVPENAIAFRILLSMSLYLFIFIFPSLGD